MLYKFARNGSYMTAMKDLTKGNILYRGVRCEERPSSIRRISYPPSKIVKLGRMNRDGQPRFYGCAGPRPPAGRILNPAAAAPAVFYELRAKVGDRIALSAWEATEPLLMYNLGYHTRALQQMGTQEQNITARQNITNAIPNETSANAQMHYRVSKAFAADVPQGKEYRYKQSVAINETLGEFELLPPDGAQAAPSHSEVAGTAYPTVQMRGDADNVVLLPTLVDSSLKIKSVNYVMIEGVNESASEYRLLTIGFANTFSDNEIKWWDEIGNEVDRRSSVSFTNGEWSVRDGNYCIIDLRKLFAIPT
jgi:hypothetical protein